MKMKLILFGALAVITGSTLQACRLTITNDTHSTVAIQSHKEGKHHAVFQPGESKPFGEQVGVENHGEMADFELSVVGSNAHPIMVKQLKCNEPMYRTHIRVSEILNKKFVGENEKLFTFDAHAPVMCGG